jgi:hypothetical protein
VSIRRNYNAYAALKVLIVAASASFPPSLLHDPQLINFTLRAWRTSQLCPQCLTKDIRDSRRLVATPQSGASGQKLPFTVDTCYPSRVDKTARCSRINAVSGWSGPSAFFADYQSVLVERPGPGEVALRLKQDGKVAEAFCRISMVGAERPFVLCWRRRNRAGFVRRAC